MCRYCNGASQCCAEPVFTQGICGRGDRAAALLLRPREGVSNRRVGWEGSAALIQPAPPTLPGCAAHYHGHPALASAGAVRSPSMTMQVTALKPWGGCAGREWCWILQLLHAACTCTAGQKVVESCGEPEHRQKVKVKCKGTRLSSLGQQNPFLMGSASYFLCERG